MKPLLSLAFFMGFGVSSPAGEKPNVLFLLAFLVFGSLAQTTASPRVFAHYMPWYSSKEVTGRWGYHWTMGHYDPDTIRWDGRREAASHDYPLIGLYDSRDPLALECQVQQMKLAGIEGVIIDWYGTRDFRDYAELHESTQMLLPVLKRAGMQFAICYEDQSIKHMVAAGHLGKEEALAHGREVIRWMDQNWFRDDSYLKQDGRPLLLVFGPQHFSTAEWKELLDEAETSPLFHTLPHLAEASPDRAVFGWPPVSDGKSVSAGEWRDYLAALYARESPTFSVAFPGFHDIYRQAGLHDSYGFISDRDGDTFRETLDLAWESGSPFVQVATWNDYGEGTVIEPTWKLGYRYLEMIQARTGNGLPAADLRLPVQLYRLRKQLGNPPGLQKASEALLSADVDTARRIIEDAEKQTRTEPVFFLEETTGDDSKYRLIRDIAYRDEELRCRLDLYYPSDGNPYATVVWFHGGGISKGNKSIPVPLRNKGVAVVSANYRLSPGVKAPVYLEDAAAAVAWTLNNIGSYGGGDPDSVFVSGHSAGGYLASMIGLDPRWLEASEAQPGQLAGLVPFSGHTITHFTVRKESGIDGKQPVIDAMAPLFHVRRDAPPMLLITGDRELELLGRYEENAYFWRMMQEVNHPDTTLRELDGFDHGNMPEPAFPLLLQFMEERSNR